MSTAESRPRRLAAAVQRGWRAFSWYWLDSWPSVLYGLLSVLAFAPFKLFPLLFFTLAAMLLRWSRARSSREAAGQGFAFGLGFYGGGVGWLYFTVHIQAQAPEAVALLCAIALVCYLSLFPTLVGWLQHRLAQRPLLRLLLLIPALWTLAELLSGWLFSGFPWMSMGVSQAPWSPLVGFAPLIGGHGLTWLVLLIAGLLALARLVGNAWYALLAVLLLMAGWGLQKLEWTEPVGAPVSVALVQGNIDQVSKWDVDKLIYTLDIHTELAERSRARLIILPETAFPIFLDDVPPSYLTRLRQRALANGGDLLLGVPLHTPDGAQYLNSVMSFGTAPSQVYSKNHLVPFGEYIPLKWAFGWLYNYINMPLVDFRRGGYDQKPLAVAGQKVALTICYEDVFGHELRQPVPAATLMANVSNDAWFGRTHAPGQHLQMVQMRALESGRWWLRATNTGVTAIVNDRGFVVDTMPQFVPGVLEGEAQGRRGITPYVRYGDYPLWSATGLVLLLALWRARRARRAGAAVPQKPARRP